MKHISSIFSAIVCSASLVAFDACGAVATTAGSNLTSYNPNNAYNNQWNTMMNPRSESGTARADFGNCNAVVLRCAQPKCANGGCASENIASAIVEGCVNSNDKCKQYGADLVKFMTAQLVANSTAKVNAANAANAEQAQAAAERAAQQAQEAANQAMAAQQQQMAEMQSSMQQQMLDLQQKMAEQNERSAQQLADALAKNQQAQQQAISDMRSVAETSAQAQIQSQPEAQIQVGSYQVTQQDAKAIDRGVDADVIRRKTIAGQVLTDIESAYDALEEARAAMQSAFDYADCDSRGENCTGPKRIKKWRELVNGFLIPYDTVVDKIDDALNVAQVVGVDLTDIYMMLNDSCNSWGEYMCPAANAESKVFYNYTNNTDENKTAPRVCKEQPEDEAAWKRCQPCTLLRVLNNGDDVYKGWINAEKDASTNQTVIACASTAMAKSKLFARKVKAKNGAGIIDIAQFGNWVNYHEPNTIKSDRAFNYCSIDATTLQ